MTQLVFWVAVIGRVGEIDEMRAGAGDDDINSPSQPTTMTSYRPGAVAASAYPVVARAPATFYQAPPRRRDFFQETADHPYYSRPGMPRYGGAGQLGHRPYVAKFTVPPRY